MYSKVSFLSVVLAVGSFAQVLVPDPGVTMPAPTTLTVPTVAKPLVRQGETASALTDVPQSVMFVKSDTTDAKTAIANIVLSEQGIHLITMGLAPGLAWNPYMNDAIMKAAKLGKGMIL